MKPLNVHLGFAAGPQGQGVAYARIGADRTLRVPFSVRRLPALLEREVAYAALTAVADVLHRRGVSRVHAILEDTRLVEDLLERRDVPAALNMAYVRLRCVLNQFREFGVAAAPSDFSDLTARARSEVAMHAAA